MTIPTALAIAEIATNRRVEGGGEHFIISCSFGTTIGAAIGIALYLSQAISVAFYMIAFAEAFKPIASLIESVLGMPFDPRNLSIFATDAKIDFSALVEEHSSRSDLVILGFTPERLARRGVELFERHPGLGDVLFVSSQREIKIE